MLTRQRLPIFNLQMKISIDKVKLTQKQRPLYEPLLSMKIFDRLSVCIG